MCDTAQKKERVGAKLTNLAESGVILSCDEISVDAFLI